MAAGPTSRSSRRYLHFSVRGLIAVVLLVGCWLGWFVRSTIQHEAVAAIDAAGGKVWYQWEWKDGKVIPRGRPWMPAWLVDRAGVDYFGSVVAAEIYSPAADVTMLHVGRLDRLVHLKVNQHSLTDHGLVHVEGLANLADLELARTQITDAGLVHLKGLTGLSRLNLRNAQVTDSGLVNLEGLTKLSKLGLAETRVTDAGLVHLKGLANLRSLNLESTQVTDLGLIQIKRSPSSPISLFTAPVSPTQGSSI